MVSHAIAHLINRDFVSLHRDSESAQNHLPSWRKYLPNWENKKENETKTPSLETSRFAKYFF